MKIFHSILYIFLIQICERRPWVPGPTIRRLLVIFFFRFFFFESDRPTQYQETHWTVNEEKKGAGHINIFYQEREVQRLLQS